MRLPFSILVASLSSQGEDHLAHTLEDEGYQVYSSVGVEALRAQLAHPVDLVLLDLISEDELEAFAAARAACQCACIVIGPARSPKLLVAALDRGADDYVARPFRTAELLARVRAHLRRRRPGSSFVLSFGHLSLDPQERQARRDGALLDLTSEEFTLLSLLASRPGNPYPPGFIAGQIWGAGRNSEADQLALMIARLRTLIEADPTNPAILGGDLLHGFWLNDRAHERQLNALG